MQTFTRIYFEKLQKKALSESSGRAVVFQVGLYYIFNNEDPLSELLSERFDERNIEPKSVE